MSIGLFTARRNTVLGRVLTVLLICCVGQTLFAQLEIRPQRANANYEAGEQIVFDVESNRNGSATYVIRHDNFSAPLATGTVYLSTLSTEQIRYTLNEPGVVFCYVTQNGITARASAGQQTAQIGPLEPAPADYDAFWTNQKNQLAGVSIDPQLNYYSQTAYSTTYKISLGHIDGRRVYGYLSVPNGGGPFPAAITYPSYGNAAGLVQPEWALAERANMLSLSLSIHNAPPDQVDPNGYQPDNIYDRDEIYYRYAVLAGVRAIDYLRTRPDFDGVNIAALGVSQGGGLATLLAGIDQRVTLLGYSNNSHAQHPGLKYGKASGFPFYIHTVRSAAGTSTQEETALQAAKYYDAIYAAARYRGPVLLSTSYEDETAPAATQFATSNQFEGPKILIHHLDGGHADNPDEYWSGRYDFFRRYFNTSANPPWPYAPSTKGYRISAGSDKSTTTSSTNLSGVLQKENNSDYPVSVKWEKISGPGSVSFSNAFSKNTSVNFSASGTYRLRFSARDESMLAGTRKFYSFSDEVTINVSGGTDNQAPIPTLSTNSTQVTGAFQVQLSFNENVSGFSTADVNVVNGSLTNWSGSGSEYTLTVQPQNPGTVLVNLPAGRVQDAAGNTNQASNQLSINYAPIVSGGEADLELNIQTTKNGFSIYDNIDYALTVENKGDVTATDIVIQLPSVTGQAFVSHTATDGSFANWTGEWRISSLPVGSSARLDLLFFTLQDDQPMTRFAQVMSANPGDVDSTPGNNNDQTPREDDETSVTLTPGTGGGDTDPPVATLSTDNTSVSGDFSVQITFSEAITGLSQSDFTVSNGTGSDLQGSANSYSMTISPQSIGNVFIQLQANAVTDAAGNANPSSNNLVVNYQTGSGGGNGDYCAAKGEQPWQEWIARVQFGDIDHDSGKNGYGDFLNVTTEVATGSNLPISITPAYSYWQYGSHVRAWIDFNRDGDFNDPQEQVFSEYRPEGIAGTPPQALIGSVEIPAGIAAGTTRLRVALSRTGFPDYCDNLTYGEVEDYTVSLVSGGTPNPPQDYCDSKGNQPWEQWIERVQLADLDNESWKNGYGDFTDQSASLSLNQSVQIQLTPGHSGQRFMEYWRVWIDYNQDGDFNDSGELVLEDRSRNRVSGSFNVPGSAASGNTRMRVVMNRGDYQGSCSTFEFGETEDYTVSINGASGFAAPGRFLRFDLEQTAGHVVLDWVVSSTRSTSRFIVERATNANKFTFVEEVPVVVQSGSAVQFQSLDRDPQNGVNRYRIRQLFDDGREISSQVRMIELGAVHSLLVTPNPSDGRISVWNPHDDIDPAQLQLFDAGGGSIVLPQAQSTNVGRFDLDLSYLPAGLYVIYWRPLVGKPISQKILIHRP